MNKMIYKIVSAIVIAVLFAACSAGDGGMFGSNDKNDIANGEGGSMARMTIVGDYLYTVDVSSLKVFDISDPTNVMYLNTSDVGNNIETIFGFKNNLYIGSGNAVYIYSINDPEHPVLLETIQHMYSCDPVVANDTIAFSTIRTTSECRRNSWGVNELIIMDVENIHNIHVTHTYELGFEPYGIGLEDTIFFLCKGDQGIDVFDVKDFDQFVLPTPINHIGNIHAFDVIPYNDLLIVVGETGMELYNIADIANIQKLSGIYPD
jgi:hypothetical protein